MPIDLKARIPPLYEDQEFLAFLDACSEALELLRQDIQGLRDIYRPQKTPSSVLEHLLKNLGWSRPWYETEAGRRKLARFLRRILDQRGTNKGIANMIRLITGLECIVRNQPRDETTAYPWPAGSREWYTFEIIPPRVLTPEEEAAVMRCADYMKPAHTYYRILPPADHWELGISELDTQARLH